MASGCEVVSNFGVVGGGDVSAVPWGGRGKRRGLKAQERQQLIKGSLVEGCYLSGPHIALTQTFVSEAIW